MRIKIEKNLKENKKIEEIRKIISSVYCIEIKPLIEGLTKEDCKKKYHCGNLHVWEIASAIYEIFIKKEKGHYYQIFNEWLKK